MIRNPKPLPETKVCSTCGNELSSDCFRKRNKVSASGIQYQLLESQCLDCESKRNKRTVIAGMSKSDYLKQYRASRNGDLLFYIKTRIGTIRNRAKADGIAFNVTPEYLLELFERQDGKCYYTGIALDYSYGKQVVTNASMSLDRLEPNKGYTVGNVVWCSYLANTMKRDMNEEDFYALLRGILDYRGRG